MVKRLTAKEMKEVKEKMAKQGRGRKKLAKKKVAKKKTVKKKVTKKKTVKQKALKKPVKKRTKKTVKKTDPVVEALQGMEGMAGEVPFMGELGSLEEALETLKKYVKEEAADLWCDSPKPLTPLSAMPKARRRLDVIAAGRKPPTFTPHNELNDSFFQELSKNVEGGFIGDDSILETLGEKTFRSIETQMADAYLLSLQSHRRMKVLNKLLNTSYELLDENLGNILKAPEEDGEKEGSSNR